MNTKILTAILLLGGLTLVCTHIQASEGGSTVASGAKVLPPASTKTGLTFDKDIKPLFEASCVRCHGEKKAKADLNLTTLETTLAGGEDGKVIEVGNSAKSSLVKAIARISPKTAMPPEPRKPRPAASGQGEAGKETKPEAAGGSKQDPPPKPLTAEEVGIVRAWIDQGAK